MNFEEIAKKNGIDVDLVGNYHQHQNGDGWVSNNAHIDNSAFIGENAWISDYARIYGNAKIYGNTWKTSPLYIQGSKWSLTNCKYGYIQIGCHCKSIDWWVANGLSIAKIENMSDDEINEYTAYIKLFQLIGK